MDPITIGLAVTSGLGKLFGIGGGKKRKQISPEQLKQLFGAKAISDEQVELFNRVMASPQGQSLMTGAAQSGQQFQTDVARGAAEAGLGPAGGASGGTDIFAGAASQSATGNLQRAMQAQMMQAMLPIAQQLVSDRMQAWLGDRDKVLGQTTKFQDIMGAVSGLGSDLLASRQANQVGQTGGEGAPEGNRMGAPGWTYPVGGQSTGTTDPGQSSMSVAPPSANPQMATMGGPAGTTAVTPQPQMPGMAIPLGGMRRRPDMLQGSGRFARAMSARNRFGAVQSAA